MSEQGRTKIVNAHPVEVFAQFAQETLQRWRTHQATAVPVPSSTSLRRTAVSTRASSSPSSTDRLTSVVCARWQWTTNTPATYLRRRVTGRERAISAHRHDLAVSARGLSWDRTDGQYHPLMVVSVV